VTPTYPTSHFPRISKNFQEFLYTPSLHPTSLFQKIFFRRKTISYLFSAVVVLQHSSNHNHAVLQHSQHSCSSLLCASTVSANTLKYDGTTAPQALYCAGGTLLLRRRHISQLVIFLLLPSLFSKQEREQTRSDYCL